MTPLDTWFLHVEDDADHMHIGSVGIFAGPAPEADALRQLIEAKLDALPRYRQRVSSMPLGLARPIWTDDPHFTIEYHVRHTALPRPGGVAQLRTLVGRVMGQQLDRRRPLWETWFVEGLTGGRWAMVSKVHHCMVDGIAGTDLLALVLDAEPRSEPPEVVDGWEPERSPGGARLAARAAAELARAPLRAAGAVPALARHPGRMVTRVRDTARGAAGLAALFRPMPPTSLTGPIGPHRRWAGARVDLAAAKRVRAHLGGTVNDVVLAVIATGFRDLLAARGELDDTTEVRTMVPVSTRRPDQRGQYHNLVSAMFVSLPVGVEDPQERYAALRADIGRTKGSGETDAVSALIGLSGVAPEMLVGVALRTTTRLVQRYGQRYVSTVTTNVPGPQFPLYLLGRRMEEAYPFVPIGEGLRIGVAIFSYDGMLTFGVTGDYDTSADLDVLTRGIERGMDELVAACP